MWHQRLGHINDRYLEKTSRAVLDLEDIEKKKGQIIHDSINCIACCKGKLAKKTIPSKQSPRATEVGERVHVDIDGPVGASSIEKHIYQVLFKDEYSNFRFVYTMKSRDETYGNMKKVVSSIMAETKMPV